MSSVSGLTAGYSLVTTSILLASIEGKSGAGTGSSRSTVRSLRGVAVPITTAPKAMLMMESARPIYFRPIAANSTTIAIWNQAEDPDHQGGDGADGFGQAVAPAAIAVEGLDLHQMLAGQVLDHLRDDRRDDQDDDGGDHLAGWGSPILVEK